MIESAGQEGLQFITKVAEFLPLILYVYDLDRKKIIFSNRLSNQFIDHLETDIYQEEGFFYKGIHPSDKNSLFRFLEDCRTTQKDEPIEVDYRFNKQNGGWNWLHQRAIAFSRHNDGSPHLILNLIEDVTERKQNEETLLRFSTALKMTSDSVLITDLSNKILDANDAALKLYGVKNKQDLVGKDWFDFVLAEDKDAATTGMRQVLITGFLKGIELNIQSGTGKTLSVEVSISIITNAGRAFVGLVIITRDITERKRTEEQLRFISSYDALTKLYNRFSFQEKVTQIENGQIEPLSVIMIDADGLKKVNDNLGHAAGDQFLISIAEVLKKSFRQGDFIARIGGDEFAVLLPGAGAIDLERTIERIKMNILKENQNQPGVYELSVSIGGYTAEKGEMVRQALFFADEKMYAEKSSKKQKIKVDFGGDGL